MVTGRRGSECFRRPGDTITLVVPMPPTPNSRSKAHPMATHRAAEAYKRQVWEAVIQQVTPLQDPPARVRLRSRFKFYGKRMDRDNRWGAMKWLVDALKQRQLGDAKFRGMVADQAGYFVDDDDRFLLMEEPEVVPGRHEPQVVELTLEVME